MSVIRNIPIGRKFIIAFGIVCVLCLALGTYTFFTFLSIARSTRDVSGHAFPSVVHLSEARSALNLLRRADLDLMLCQTADCTAKYSAMRQNALTGYQTEIKAYEPLISYPGERELYEKVETAFVRYRETSDQAVALMAANKTAEAVERFSSESTVAIFTAVSNSLGEDLKLNATAGLQDADNSTEASSRTLWIEMIATLVIIALCVSSAPF